nr:hypothetical protein [Lachnospiraceae bacterium]
LYLNAVVGINSSQGKTAKNTNVEYDKKLKSSSHLLTYFKKEWLILIRTPAYMTNCVGINFIWPVFIYVFILIQKQSNFLGDYLNKVKSADAGASLNLILVVFGISVILTALNCLASSAITREGKHFEIMKYMPVPLTTQLNSKALISIVISGAGLIVYIITAFIILGISPLLTVYCVALSILSVIFTTYLGIYIDTMNPKLIWEDEVNALRGNYHVFFNMAISLMITAAICIASNLLYKFELLPVGVIFILLILFAAAMTVFTYLLCNKKGAVNLMKIEM